MEPKLGDLLYAPWYREHDENAVRTVLVIAIDVERDFWTCRWCDDGVVTWYRARDFKTSEFVVVSRAPI